MSNAGFRSFKHGGMATHFGVLFGIPLLVELSYELSQLCEKSDIQNFTKSSVLFLA